MLQAGSGLQFSANEVDGSGDEYISSPLLLFKYCIIDTQENG